jgi:UDP-2,4-diacetamido-2,4,6-trideoxy-beta-L-altropyranose hydrolase
MRCLALAQAWQDGGGDAAFAAAEIIPALDDRLRANQFQVAKLSGPPGSEEDIRELAEFARVRKAQWVVLDGYQFASASQRILKQAGFKVLSIDDKGACVHYFADMVLNQNLHANEGMYVKREPSTSLLMGVRYCLLRREFNAWRGWKREILPIGTRVLVTMGGSDPDNITATVVEALKRLKVINWSAIVLAGRLAEDLEREAGGLPVQVMRNVVDVPRIMDQVDIAVSAAGSTLWELAFMGVPAIAVWRGPQERLLVDGASETGVALSLGHFQQVDPKKFSKAIERLANDVTERRRMSEAGQGCVDGMGTVRVIEAMRAQCN